MSATEASVRMHNALHFMSYNFTRIHETVKCSPAMAAGVSRRLWDVGHIVTAVEEWRRGTPSLHGNRMGFLGQSLNRLFFSAPNSN
jgi:hypothetical protein